MDHNTKYPIFAAPRTTHAQLLFREAHAIAAERENYWIPKLRQKVRSLIS